MESIMHMDEPFTFLCRLLDIAPPENGESFEIQGRVYRFSEGILRQKSVYSSSQAQSGGVFGYKWHRRETYEGNHCMAITADWLKERYGDVTRFFNTGKRAVMLDAGCGAALSSLALFPHHILNENIYIGTDISDAVEVGRKRFEEKNVSGAFMQADLMTLPFPEKTFDIIFSEGVLHHTDSTEQALEELSRLLKPGGFFLFYVYNKKGPVREFTDDYIRKLLQEMTPEQAWSSLDGLTEFGRLLGELNVELDIKKSVPLLNIPAGKISLQRFFYWHIFKAFYHPDMSVHEMQHINFDWYAPKNAHRQTPEQVAQWCGQSGLEILEQKVEKSGITVIAQRCH